mmetsp:Transcript_1470/g.2453  ORF Transcript_1470/g.2453 Transcript_1470/m.2453 type:complete len:164 (+) Transcript_1470:113-604(+)
MASNSCKVLFQQALRRASLSKVAQTQPTWTRFYRRVSTSTTKELSHGRYDILMSNNYRHLDVALVATAVYETGSLTQIRLQRTTSQQMGAYSSTPGSTSTFSCPRSPLTKLAANTSRLTWHRSLGKASHGLGSLPALLESDENEVEFLGGNDESILKPSVPGS